MRREKGVLTLVEASRGVSHVTLVFQDCLQVIIQQGENCVPYKISRLLSESRLRAAGKPEKVARCAAARKLLHLAWAVVKKDQPFDPHYMRG